MKRTVRALTGILPFPLIASVVSIMSSCGGSSSTTPTASNGANSYYGTQSPGDAWSWTITKDSSGNGAFSATNKMSGRYLYRECCHPI